MNDRQPKTFCRPWPPASGCGWHSWACFVYRPRPVGNDKSFSLFLEFLYTGIKNRQHELLDQCGRFGLPRAAGGEMHGWMICAADLGGG